MLVQGKDASVDKLVESPGFHPGKFIAGASPTRGANHHCRILKLVNEDRLWGVRSSVGPRTVDPMRRVQLSYTPPKSVAFGLRWFKSSSCNQALSYSWSSIPDSHSGDVEFESPKSCHLKDPRSKLITVYIGSTPIQITWSRLSGLGCFMFGI